MLVDSFLAGRRMWAFCLCISFVILVLIGLQSHESAVWKSQPGVGEWRAQVEDTSSEVIFTTEPATSNHMDTFEYEKAMVILKNYTRTFNNSQVPPDVDPGRPETFTKWYQAAAMLDYYITDPPVYHCGNISRMGKSDWWLCMDSEVKVTPPCLVYSFGINWEWEFDDAMGSLGCEVHSFDPSMSEPDHKRSDNITFHNLGMGSTNHDVFNPRKDRYTKEQGEDVLWKVRTVKSIMQMLGHENRVLDVLKMDVEGYEWDIVNNLLETGVFGQTRMFMLEWHLFPGTPPYGEYINYLQMYTKLVDKGLKVYKRTPKERDHHFDLLRYRFQSDSFYINPSVKRRQYV